MNKDALGEKEQFSAIGDTSEMASAHAEKMTGATDIKHETKCKEEMPLKKQDLKTESEFQGGTNATTWAK